MYLKFIEVGEQLVNLTTTGQIIFDDNELKISYCEPLQGTNPIAEERLGSIEEFNYRRAWIIKHCSISYKTMPTPETEKPLGEQIPAFDLGNNKILINSGSTGLCPCEVDLIEVSRIDLCDGTTCITYRGHIGFSTYTELFENTTMYGIKREWLMDRHSDKCREPSVGPDI